MFEQMIAAIQEETLRRLFLVRLRQNQEVRRERVAKVTGESGASDGTCLLYTSVVKAELIVGAVGDVGRVGVLLGLSHDAVDHQTHGEAHEAVHLAHPLGVTLGQIVVDGDDVDALARQGVQIGREGGHQMCIRDRRWRWE